MLLGWAKDGKVGPGRSGFQVAGPVQFTANINLSPGHAGHDGSNREIQGFGDFLVAQPVEIEHFDGGFQPVIQFVQNLPEVAGFFQL